MNIYNFDIDQLRDGYYECIVDGTYGCRFCDEWHKSEGSAEKCVQRHLDEAAHVGFSPAQMVFIAQLIDAKLENIG